MRPFDELVSLVSEFPGIGPRQARRIVQFLLSKNAGFSEKLATLIRDVKKNTVQCTSCFRFDDSISNGACRTCLDPNRDTTLLMVVEKDVDIEGVEASGVYRGRYFVLGGLMAMTQRRNAPTLRTKELLARIQKNGISEIIFALSTTPEGDYTAREVMQEIKGITPSPKATLLGRGLSLGAEIEYSDADTIRSAFKNRA